jgi:putative membrane protein
MRFIVKIIISAFAVMIASYVLPGVKVDAFTTALLVALVFSFLNAFLKPLLVLLTIPVTLFSFGLFLLVINAVIVLLAARIVPTFHVDGFWWALAFSIIMTLASSLLESIGGNNNSPSGRNY